MEKVLDRLISSLDESNHIFVFPSEVTARAWLEHLLESPKQSRFRAIREDRIISWDRFKEQLFPRKESRLPVNGLYRLVFAQIVIQENSRTPFLSYLIPRSYAESSAIFANSIRQLCPMLQDLSRRLGSEQMTGTLGLLARDISQLSARYTAFLDAHDLFEPSFEPEILDAEHLESTGRTYTLCFPEIMNEYQQMHEQLQDSPRIDTISIDQSDDRLPELEVYANTRIELAGALEEMESLLQRGVPAERIVITLGDYTGIYEDLAHQARLRGIPLRFRSGRPLTDYPVSRLFRDIQQVVRENFSLSSMKRLLLNRSYPWRDRSLNLRLIRAGVKASCLKNYVTRSGVTIDLWSERLKRLDDGELLDHYRLVKESCIALTGADDVDTLWTLVHKLQHTLLQPFQEDHTNRDSAVFSYCIDQLQQFRRSAQRVPLPTGFPVYSTWITMLESTWYVPQQPSDGISVYPYGVSAGIQPDHHILIGIDRSHTIMVDDPYPMLSEQEKEQLSLAAADSTDAFLRIYARSGESVSISCSRVSRAGQQLPANLFIEHDRIHEKTGGVYPSDPYKTEQLYWAGKKEVELEQLQLYPLQKESMHSASSTILCQKPLDLSEKVAESSSFRELFAQSVGDSDRGIVISPTSLDMFVSCPFSWFLKYGLHIREEHFEPEYTDARSLGILIHSCYEQLFTWIQEHTDGVFSASRIDLYRDQLSRIMREALRQYRRRFDAPVDMVLIGVDRYLTEHVHRLLSAEAAYLDGWIVDSVEGERSLVDDELHIVIEGRVDRVSKLDSGKEAAVIDYKKNNRVSVSSFGPDSEHPGSYQLPLYTYLLEHLDAGTIKVTQALYYDVTKDTYVRILPGVSKGVTVDRDRFDQVIDKMLEEIETMVRRIRRADVRIAHGRSSACGLCSFRDICRGRFSIR